MAEFSTIPISLTLSDSHRTKYSDFHPFEQPQFENLFSFFAQVRREEPIFWSPILKMWVVTRYEDVQTVLKSPQTFYSRNFFSAAGDRTPQVAELLQNTIFGSAAGGLIAADPPIHTRLRRTLTNAFSARRIAQLEPDVRILVRQLIEAFPQQGPLDVAAHFTHLLPFFVICRLIGVPKADQQQVRHWCDDIGALLLLSLSLERQLAHAQGTLALHQYMRNLLEQRRAIPQDDLATALLQAMEEEHVQLSTNELVEMLVVLLTAGFETTMHFLSACLLLLLTQREYWNALQYDPQIIPPLVEEGLRLVSPAWGIARVTTQQVKIGGVILPPNAPVYVALLSANHDERTFPHPEVLDGERTNASRHLTFGYGIHFCIGAPLARLEVRVALEELSCHFPTLRLLDQQQVAYTSGLFVRGIKHLLVEWEAQ